MYFRQAFSKITALTLLMVFLLQAGLGIWLHYTLHQHAAKSPAYSKDYLPEIQQGQELLTCCTCTDDFDEPFIGVTGTAILPPLPVYFTNVSTANYSPVICGVQRFRPLRAPPVLAV